jgi:flagellar biosynthesis protein FliP
MYEDESAEYAMWVQLANDPSQTEEARQRYRALMEDYVITQLREAFRFASVEASKDRQEIVESRPSRD